MKKYPLLYKNLAIIVKNYIVTPKPVILDLGSGPGFLSKELIQRITDGVIIGIDPEKKMLNIAKINLKIFGQNLRLISGIAEKIPLKKKSVDVVVSRFSESYWCDQYEVLNEIKRILKPNGYLIIEALNKNYPKWKLFLTKIHMTLNSASLNVIRYHQDAYKIAFNSEELESFIINSGFVITKKEGKEKEWKFLLIARNKP
jgi:ubiquinone/menaquinone biosynthesis C-methylase UbiE